MNNLFFTGEIQVGKSTLLRKLLKKRGLRPGGAETGFGPWRAEESRRLFLHPYGKPDYSEGSVCARMEPEGKIVYPAVFDGRGAALVRAAVNDPEVDVVILDELGFLEAEAAGFRAAVLDILTGPKPVLGVVRQGLGVWQDAPLGEVWEVTGENRDAVPALLRQRLGPLFPAAFR